MAVSMKSLETELKVGKALAQIKELEKAFLRVSTNGVNPINRSLSQMNALLRQSRILTTGLDKDFQRMSKAIGGIGRSTKTAASSSTRIIPKPAEQQRTLWELAKSFAESKRRAGLFGSAQNKKALSSAEDALMSRIEGMSNSALIQGQLAKLLPLIARFTTVAGGAAAAAAGLAVAFGAVAAASVALGAVFTALGLKMTETEAQLAKLQTAFQSQTKAVVEYQKAVLHAARTPFETDEVVNAVVQMQVFMVDAFQKVGKSGRQLVDILGDMAGATGTDLATATHALQRAMVGEWEIMQNNFQISARMIPQLKGLSTGTMEYKKAIIEYLEQQGRFVGGQEIMAKSLRGMLSNTKDAFTNLVTFTAGVADSKAELAGVTLYDKFRDSLYGIYDAVSRPDVLSNYANLIRDINAGGVDGEIATRKLTEALGSEAKARALVNIANDKTIKTEYQRIQALKAAGFEEDQIYSRGQKIIAMGQMLGQIMKVVYTATFKPILEGIGSGLDWLLLKFEDVGRALSSDKIFDQSVVKNAEDAKRSLTQIALDVGKNWGISAETMAGGIEKVVARMGAKGEEFDKQIRERGIHTLNGWQKAVMVFSILMEFASLYIEDKLGGIFTLFMSLGDGFRQGFSFISDGAFAAFFDYLTNTIKTFGLTNGEVTGDMEEAWAGWGASIGIITGVVANSLIIITSAIITLIRVTWNAIQIVGRLLTMFAELATFDFAAVGKTLKNIGGDFGDMFEAFSGATNVFMEASGAGPTGRGIKTFRESFVARSNEAWASEPILNQDKANEKQRKKDAEDQKKLMERQIAATKEMGDKRVDVNVNVDVASVEAQRQRQDLLRQGRQLYNKPGASEAERSLGRSMVYAAIAAENPDIMNVLPNYTGLSRPEIVDRLQQAGFMIGDDLLLRRKDGTPVMAGGQKVYIGDGGLTARAVGAFNLPSDQVIFAHKGEMIIPAREAEYLRSMITPNDGFRQGASLVGALIPSSLPASGGGNKTMKSITVNQYFMGQSGSRVAVPLYNEAANLAKSAIGVT